MLCLDRNPQAAAEVRADRSLVPGAIEEVLRYRTPFPRLGRMTTTDVELGDRRIPGRSILLPWVGAANRDPRRYPDPERFDIHRAVPHLAFGHGIHFCLGAPLARLEGRVALGQLLDRYGALTVDLEHTRYQNPWVMSSVLSLPVQVGLPAAEPRLSLGIRLRQNERSRRQHRRSSSAGGVRQRTALGRGMARSAS